MAGCFGGALARVRFAGGVGATGGAASAVTADALDRLIGAFTADGFEVVTAACGEAVAESVLAGFELGTVVAAGFLAAVFVAAVFVAAGFVAAVLVAAGEAFEAAGVVFDAFELAFDAFAGALDAFAGALDAFAGALATEVDSIAFGAGSAVVDRRVRGRALVVIASVSPSGPTVLVAGTPWRGPAGRQNECGRRGPASDPAEGPGALAVRSGSASIPPSLGDVVMRLCLNCASIGRWATHDRSSMHSTTPATG
jgi:hypothetical protein